MIGNGHGLPQRFAHGRRAHNQLHNAIHHYQYIWDAPVQMFLPRVCIVKPNTERLQSSLHRYVYIYTIMYEKLLIRNSKRPVCSYRSKLMVRDHLRMLSAKLPMCNPVIGFMTTQRQQNIVRSNLKRTVCHWNII